LRDVIGGTVVRETCQDCCLVFLVDADTRSVGEAALGSLSNTAKETRGQARGWDWACRGVGALGVNRGGEEAGESDLLGEHHREISGDGKG